MSESIAGAVRALVIAWGGVNERCWQDRAPQGATLPYVVIADTQGVNASLSGDATAQKWRRTLQVSLWVAGQDYDATLASRLTNYLDGKTLDVSTGATYGFGVESWTRIREPDENIIHFPITLTLSHDRSTA